MGGPMPSFLWGRCCEIEAPARVPLTRHGPVSRVDVFLHVTSVGPWAPGDSLQLSPVP